MLAVTIEWPVGENGVEAVDRPAEVWTAGGGLLGNFGGQMRRVLAPKGTPPDLYYRFRAGQIRWKRDYIDRLDALLVVKFVNAKNKRRKIAFLTENGFPLFNPDAPGEYSDEFLDQNRRKARELLQVAGAGVGAERMMTALNYALANHREFWFPEDWQTRENLAAALPLAGLPPLPEGTPPPPSLFGGPLNVEPRIGFAPNGASPQILFSAKSLFDYMLLECAAVATQGARVGECEYCHDLYVYGEGTHRRVVGKYCKESCRVSAARKKAKAIIAQTDPVPESDDRDGNGDSGSDRCMGPICGLEPVLDLAAAGA